MLHLIEFSAVNLLGSNVKQIMQKSTSSSDGGDLSFLDRLDGRLAGFGDFFGVVSRCCRSHNLLPLAKVHQNQLVQAQPSFVPEIVYF